MKERARFGSRLGFILVSAGCAVGLGNVWKFPYMVGQYGGAAFILIYLIFLVILGLPIMVCEFSVGRGSQKSVARSFEELEPSGTKWHRIKWAGMAGCYLLMMFYTMVAGWMLYYCILTAKGAFKGADLGMVETEFSNMLSSPAVMVLWTIVIILIAFGVCAAGLQKGVENITKVMMVSLFILMIVLAVRCVTLPGAGAGLKFYLVPDFGAMVDRGVGTVIFAAMSQAFFTLSIGIGAMAIFGSYLDKNRSLAGEAAGICGLDTLVALLAGFVVIPACFAFSAEPASGPNLVFITMPNVFAEMTGGRLWGALFFMFLTFAALSTVIAVFENIVSFAMDLYDWSRKKSVLFNIIAVTVLSMPCVLGFNILSDIHPLGAGTNIMDLEDFLVSNNILPLGSLAYVLFCTRKNGWGWDRFTAEANSGAGLKIANGLRTYMTYILPLIIIIVYIKGYYDMFSTKETPVMAFWYCMAVLFIALVVWTAAGRKEFGDIK